MAHATGRVQYPDIKSKLIFNLNQPYYQIFVDEHATQCTKLFDK